MPALLFDLDGTLADTDPLHQRAWAHALVPFGIVSDLEFYTKQIAGRRNSEITASILPQLTDAEGAALADAKEAHFRELAGTDLQPLTGLDKLLDYAKQNQLRTALVSNAPRANADLVMSTLALNFELCVLAEDLPRGKPDPLPYTTALERLGLNPTQALAFEDSPSGVRSAVAAGIRTIGLLTGHAPESLTRAGTILNVENFAALALWSLLERELT